MDIKNAEFYGDFVDAGFRKCFQKSYKLKTLKKMQKRKFGTKFCSSNLNIQKGSEIFNAHLSKIIRILQICGDIL